MIDNIVTYLNGLPKELITMVVATLPVSELRGAIPMGLLSFEMSIGKVYLFAVIGNLIPVLPLLFLLEPVSNRLRKFILWRKFFDWLFNHTRRRAELVQRYEALGLALFVALPLPITGAWTGCVAATLFKIKFRYAFSAIAAGVLISGVIVTILTLAGKLALATI